MRVPQSNHVANQSYKQYAQKDYANKAKLDEINVILNFEGWKNGCQ